MNKKGLYSPVDYAVYMFFVIVVALFIAFATYDYLNEEIDTVNLETFLLTKKILYSDTCLAYNNGVRVHQGIIDLEKLNTNTLNNCFTKQGLGYIVKILGPNEETIKTAYNLNKIQEADLPVCKTISNTKCLKKRDIILYYDKGEIKKGYLDIEVISYVS